PVPTWFDEFNPPQQAVELHVVGPQSLVRLLPPLTPFAGAPTVWNWLTSTEPADFDTIATRQTAVRELVPHADWRERMSVFASRVRGRTTSLNGFKGWAASVAAESSQPWAARILAVVTVVAIVLAVSNRIPSAAAMILLAINLATAHRSKKRIDAILADIATADRRIHGVADLLAESAEPTFASAGLNALQDRMERGRSAAALRRLESIVSFGDLRFSPMAHAIAQAVVLWDAHVLDALDRWRHAHGAGVAEWLTALGELEAHAALATLGYDNPGWTFPDIEPAGRDVIECSGLAHPMLSESTRVTNDVSFGPRGDVLLVTGPNMAGKSTLLRAIGLNVLLAQLGAPVCASAMRTIRVRLRTSIHAIDALESGVSLFMAELMRVKGIVEDSQIASGAPVLYVVDEMLRGTNSEERHVAVASVLARLIQAGAIGVVSTHDVELAREPSLAGRRHNVHFSAQFGERDGAPNVSFDYRLQPGPATGRNAMRLLEVMGLS
ncbi:MAG: hypothetical protein ABI442_18010, partial [Gemmatimonadaceae bacterium]